MRKQAIKGFVLSPAWVEGRRRCSCASGQPGHTASVRRSRPEVTGRRHTV